MRNAFAAAALFSLAAVLVPCDPVSAKRPRPGRLSLEEVGLMLYSPDLNELQVALEAASSLSPADVVPLLVDRIQAGLSPALLDVAVDSLALLGGDAAVEALSGLLSHRRPAVRLHCVEALIALRSGHVVRLLAGLLGDPNPAVREAAAVGLGEIGGQRALDPLFKAFDRGVKGAGRSLGLLAHGGTMPRVLQYVGQAPLAGLIPMLDALLSRRDLEEANKLELVARLRELGTVEARGYLEGLSARLPLGASPGLRRAVHEAVARFGP